MLFVIAGLLVIVAGSIAYRQERDIDMHFHAGMNAVCTAMQLPGSDEREDRLKEAISVFHNVLLRIPALFVSGWNWRESISARPVRGPRV